MATVLGSVLKSLLEFNAKKRNIILERVYPDNIQNDAIVYKNGITLNNFEVSQYREFDEMVKLVNIKLNGVS